MKSSNNYSFNICSSVETVHFFYIFRQNLKSTFKVWLFQYRFVSVRESERRSLPIHSADTWRLTHPLRRPRWKVLTGEMKVCEFQSAALSRVTETRSIHLSWLHWSAEARAAISRRPKGIFICVWAYFCQPCLCLQSLNINLLNPLLLYNWLSHQRCYYYRPADSRRFVETLSFSHLSCLWRHAVSSQALPASPEIRSRTSALALRAQILGYCS